MRSMFLRSVIGSAFLSIVLTGQVVAGDIVCDYVKVGTGSVVGLYFPVGGAMCTMLNSGYGNHGIRCSAEVTDGSIANLTMLKEKTLDFAVVQSDWQAHAYHGTSKFAEVGANTDLRALFSLYNESFTVVTRQDVGAKDFASLKGKKIDIGSVGSGHRSVVEALMTGLGWESNAISTSVVPNDLPQALCSKNIDGFIYTVGHPSPLISQASLLCDVALVNVEGTVVDEILNKDKYYSKTVIPGGLYKGNDKDTTTFGLKTTVVTRADVSEKSVYEFVKATFENIDNLKKMHPTLENLDPKQMLEGNIAPLHSGAEKYYKEKGWMK